MYVIGINPHVRWFATETHHGHADSFRMDHSYEPVGFAPGTRGITDETFEGGGFENRFVKVGNEYVCVRMKSDASAGAFEVVICANASWMDAEPITKALLDANLNGNIGILTSGRGLTANEYGWALVKGQGVVRLPAGRVNGQTQLYTSATAGRIGASAMNQTAIYGISLLDQGRNLGFCRVLYPTGLL